MIYKLETAQKYFILQQYEIHVEAVEQTTRVHTYGWAMSIKPLMDKIDRLAYSKGSPDLCSALDSEYIAQGDTFEECLDELFEIAEKEDLDLY